MGNEVSISGMFELKEEFQLYLRKDFDSCGSFFDRMELIKKAERLQLTDEFIHQLKIDNK